ncbi:MAG: fluoride efflux transporter CrcB [Pyrinomonadaceae bacterium]|nr:fluoride efflux transporter CrcB [Pyrinomonadaceae bacterium]
MEIVAKFGVVAIGGALGAMLRYALTYSALPKMLAPFPATTFFINITGSFAIGFFLTLVVERYAVSDYWRLFFAVGFLGAYTTFSTFEFETLELLRGKDFFNVALYVSSSVFIGLIAVFGGVWLAKKF